MRKNYRGSVMCKAVMQSSPQRFPTPANRGKNRGSVHAGTACSITLRGYRRRTRTFPQDPSTPATNVLTSQRNCTSNYSHHGIAATNYTLTQYITTIFILTQSINDYFYSHTVNSKRLFIQPHIK